MPGKAARARREENRNNRKKRPNWERNEFVAIDSEGVTRADGSHDSILWMARDRRLYAPQGLTSGAIIEWLLDLSEVYARSKSNGGTRAWFVVYGASYDFNMLLRDAPFETAQKIHAAGATFNSSGATWKLTATLKVSITYIPRKLMIIRELLGYDEDKKAPIIGRHITIYDVIGFFQTSFLVTCQKWLGKDYQELELIKAGKSQRFDFVNWNIDRITRYTRAELTALELVMAKLWDALNALGLKLTKWHGAGAVASALLDKEGCRGIPHEMPDDVTIAARHAYFGGRIELFKFGHHDGPIYSYDINSAYPHAMRFLPNLAGTRWLHGGPGYHWGEPFAVYRISWRSKIKQPINPFPYRSEISSKVLFPAAGMGWYWASEIDAAADNGFEFEILESWYLHDACLYPFDFIPAYYKRRQELVQAAKKAGTISGEEMVIKLGLNSLYGKTAQTAGGRSDKPPPFHNMFYAGFITAMTRAALYRAAMTNPDAIIMIATDGIYATEPLDIPIDETKTLGGWEQTIYDGGIFAQSGYYFLKKGGKWEPKTRGFDKLRSNTEVENQINTILSTWRDGGLECSFPCTRFLTMGTALASPKRFEKWCRWESMQHNGHEGRALYLYPEGTKRERATKKQPNPANGLNATMPAPNLTPNAISAIYELGWLDESGDLERILDQELIYED